jgi:8-oxo-dGTP diphosphatase
MKILRVAAAVIMRRNSAGNAEFLAVKKAKGEFKGKWEFPGGKIEAGESAEETVVREIREELSAEISVQKKIAAVQDDCPNFRLQMECFLCVQKSAEIKLSEHDDLAWLPAENLRNVEFLPADKKIAEILQNEIF